MNKKSMIFTLLVIAILSLFLISYTVYSVNQERKTIHQRVKTLNNFVFSVEEDLSRQIYISAFRITLIFEKKITESGSYITNINSTFSELFYNGTLYGEQEELMQGIIFSDIVSSLNEKGREINAEIALNNPKISITQDDPWNIKIILETNLVINDKNDLVMWNKTAPITVYVPIKNFEDPLYTINTNSLVINKINETIYQPFVEGNNVTNLNNHVIESYYVNSSLAPSFLDRLQGKSTANEQGIESLVNLQELSNQGINIKTKSVVDYIYFSELNPGSHTIQGMPNWFRIDDEHLDIYEVRNLVS